LARPSGSDNLVGSQKVYTFSETAIEALYELFKPELAQLGAALCMAAARVPSLQFA
jgi:hypothetical protein